MIGTPRNRRPPAAYGAASLPPRRVIRLNSALSVHESDLIRQIGTHLYAGIVQSTATQSDTTNGPPKPIRNQTRIGID